MSEDEQRKVANTEEETDEVEAHGHRKFNANEEAPAEGASDDDVEAHVHRSNVPKKQ